MRTARGLGAAAAAGKRVILDGFSVQSLSVEEHTGAWRWAILLQVSCEVTWLGSCFIKAILKTYSKGLVGKQGQVAWCYASNREFIDSGNACA